MTAACRSGAACPSGVVECDADGVEVRVGCPLDRDGLCPDCTGRVHDALVHLPLDVAELSTLLHPSLAVRYRNPDLPAPPRRRTAPLPLREDVHTLRGLIVHESTAAAADLAIRVRVPWSPSAARRSRMGDAVKRSCALLDRWLPWFLDMPDTVYPARSLSVRRADGHDPDTTTRDRADYWCERDGVARALVLVGLHERVWQVAGRVVSDRLPTPCPDCGAPLYREHARGTVRCSAGHRISDDEYDEFTALAVRLAEGGVTG